MDSTVITVTSDTPLDSLDNKTFQVHVLPNNTLKLYPVTLDSRCPIIIGSERCGLKVGHEGKHMWAGGD